MQFMPLSIQKYISLNIFVVEPIYNIIVTQYAYSVS